MISVKLNNAVMKNIRKKIEDAPGFFKREDAKALGEAVVDEMKSLISKGISPIKSVGRLPGYLYQGKKGKYPDSVKKKYPGKKQRPVNLTLTGDMLRALKSRVTKGKFSSAIEIGYFVEREAKKEQGHREGVHGQPPRPTIPEGDEVFAAKIQTLIIRAYREAYAKFVKK